MFLIRLLDRNAEVVTCVAVSDRNTPLHLAAIKGFTNVGRKLIEKGAYVAVENGDHKNPLALAYENNHYDFAVLIVKSMEAKRSVIPSAHA